MALAEALGWEALALAEVVWVEAGVVVWVVVWVVEALVLASAEAVLDWEGRAEDSDSSA